MQDIRAKVLVITGKDIPSLFIQRVRDIDHSLRKGGGGYEDRRKEKQAEDFHARKLTINYCTIAEALLRYILISVNVEGMPVCY